MTIVHASTIPITQDQIDFEKKCEAVYPGHFNFDRSDLFRGDYQSELTRYAYAGYLLALS